MSPELLLPDEKCASDIPFIHLRFVSARTRIDLGSNILITGFVIGGSTPKTVLIRAVGVEDTLPDPRLMRILRLASAAAKEVRATLPVRLTCSASAMEQRALNEEPKNRGYTGTSPNKC